MSLIYKMKTAYFYRFLIDLIINLGLLLCIGLASTNPSGPASSNKTNFATSRCSSLDSGSLTCKTLYLLSSYCHTWG